MKKNILIILFGISTFISCNSTKSISIKDVENSQNIEETTKIITELASDKYEGRYPGTKTYDDAVNFVESFLKENNINPFYNNCYKDTLLVNNKVSYNIVGLIGKKRKNKEYILLGAHLDHLGKSRNRFDSVYNGANDNASGVTAILQIAKELNKHKFKQNIIIALFTGEEEGLIGSEHLAKRLKKEGVKLKYVLNIDMIGTPPSTTLKNKVYITGYKKSNCASEINKTLNKEFIYFWKEESFFGVFYMSDNYPFYKTFKIPSHTISTFNFDNYKQFHKTDDEIKQLDIQNINDIINSLTFSIYKLLANNIDIKNTQVQNK